MSKNDIEKALETLESVASNLSGLAEGKIEKAGSGLVPKKVLVKRGGKSFYQVFHVAPHQDTEEDEKRVLRSIDQLHRHIDPPYGETKEEKMQKKIEKIDSMSLEELSQYVGDLERKIKDFEVRHRRSVPSKTDLRLNEVDEDLLRHAKQQLRNVRYSPHKAAAKSVSTPTTSTDKKVVGHDKYNHPQYGEYNKGDKVTFEHKGEMKGGKVIRVNKYQRFPNPYVLMEGSDGKKYEIVISKVNVYKDKEDAGGASGKK